jgi:PAS domain S-box-containing protein
MWTCVHLLSTPVSLLHAALEYGEAGLRELALLGFAASSDGAPDVVTAPRLDLGPLMAALDDALLEGISELDLALDFPPSAEDAAISWLSAADQAERLGAEDRLLILPAVPEIALCRRWCLGQIAVQLRGDEPTAWEYPGGEADRSEVMPLSADAASPIDACTDGMVVADGSNRIVHVNAVGADLLGWTPEQLVGQRLTAIIPSSHRAAHLAGFTRYQLTGEGPLIGVTTRMPVLRHDGSVLTAMLTIGVLGSNGRDRLFHARFTPVDDG